MTLTPLERADKVRDGMKRESPRLLSDVLVHILPGSLILTPDEAEKVRQAFRTLEIGHSFFAGEREQMEEALALLAGKGEHRRT